MKFMRSIWPSASRNARLGARHVPGLARADVHRDAFGRGQQHRFGREPFRHRRFAQGLDLHEVAETARIRPVGFVGATIDGDLGVGGGAEQTQARGDDEWAHGVLRSGREIYGPAPGTPTAVSHANLSGPR
jgi:hypothetical protein